MGCRGLVLLLAVALAGCVGGASTNAPSAGPSASSAGSYESAMPSASGSPSAAGSASVPPASQSPSMAPRPTFAAGAAITTITDAVRLRSRPEVSDASVKYEPTLPLATELHVLAGPVAGSGLWWYRVELPNPVTLYHGIREGWIAAGARDGTAWIGPVADVDCYDSCPPPPTPVSGWPMVKRGDVVMTGELAGSDELGDLAVDVRIVGLLPGSSVDLAAVGTFEADWECFDPSGTPAEPEPTSSAFEGGLDPYLPPSEDRGSTKGSATAEAPHVPVNAIGVASASLALRPTHPTRPCPSGWRLSTFSGQWAGIRVTDQLHGLALTPDQQFWDTVI